jgi:hypothetical protein
MAKHRSHIQSPILEKSSGRQSSGLDFVFSDNLDDWKYGDTTAGRKRRKQQKAQRETITTH